MPVRSTAADAVNDWSRGLANATPKIERRVAGVTVAPGTQAAAQKEKYRANVAAATDKWARNVAGVSLEEWKRQMLGVGVPRISQGAEAAKADTQAAFESLYAFENTVLADVERMPSRTLDENIGRATAWMRRMAGYVKPA